MTIQSTANGEYDLATYLIGSGEVYETSNTWAGGERMQCQRVANGAFYYVKNAHFEKLILGNAFYRDIDTSYGDGRAYTLSEADGTAGLWCKRYMAIGESFKRTARVRVYELATGKLVKDYTETTLLKLVNVHTTWASGFGVTLSNVAEFEVAHEGKAPFERYFYGGSLGLVGWQDIATNRRMGVSARPGNLPALTRMSVPWYTGAKLAPYIEASDSRWQAYTAKSTTANGTNVRSEPTTGRNNVIASLKAGEVYPVKSIGRGDLTAIEAAASQEGDKVWYPLVIDGKGGWARSDVTSVELAVSAPPPIPEPPPILVPTEREALFNVLLQQADLLKALYAVNFAMREHLTEDQQAILAAKDKAA